MPVHDVEVRAPKPPDHLTEKERVTYVEAHELEEAIFRLYVLAKTQPVDKNLLDHIHRQACMLKRWIGDYRSDSVGVS